MAETRRRIHENEQAYCDGCTAVTNTIHGRCPVCGHVKDDAWIPPPRRRRLIGDGPEDWLVATFATGLLIALAKAIAALL